MSKTKMFTSALVMALTTSAIVAPVSASAITLSDVDKNTEDGKAIYNLVDRGVIKGFGDGTFKPHNPITRAQVAQVIAKVIELDTTNVSKNGFSDIPASSPTYNPIVALAEAGIMPGYANNQFKPYRAITREEMASVLVKAFELAPVKNQLMPFDDVRTDTFLYENVKILYANNITKGVSATKFGPTNAVTRSQFALFLTRAEAIPKAPPEEVKPTPPEEVKPTPPEEVKPTPPEEAKPTPPVTIDSVKLALASADFGATTLKVQPVKSEQLIVEETADGLEINATAPGTTRIVIHVMKDQKVQQKINYDVVAVDKAGKLQVNLINKGAVVADTPVDKIILNEKKVTFEPAKLHLKTSNGKEVSTDDYTYEKRGKDYVLTINKSGEYIATVESPQGHQQQVGVAVTGKEGQFIYDYALDKNYIGVNQDEVAMKLKTTHYTQMTDKRSSAAQVTVRMNMYNSIDLLAAGTEGVQFKVALIDIVDREKYLYGTAHTIAGITEIRYAIQ
ncbi:S-layer homology domain-containing protein [Metalysinibacillus jejuensis]|uniref:S-layer homology domain-containing protein n=1 Tax=Metalysinibacillus jejuensis TaxID=914327 RepID=UPI001379B687|nr:S-layer homology domain-containing protein [Metalysinibacillus jejuensis]